MSTETLTVWQLARLAECYEPHTAESEGAQFLGAIASCIDDYRDADDIDDSAHAIADYCVPVYTYNLWATFVDLGAYRVLDDDDGLIDRTGESSMIAAGALYRIGRRLALRLLEGDA